jgi:uncharacterized protein YodC (DUF2158 family)
MTAVKQEKFKTGDLVYHRLDRRPMIALNYQNAGQVLCRLMDQSNPAKYETETFFEEELKVCEKQVVDCTDKLEQAVDSIDQLQQGVDSVRKLVDSIHKLLETLLKSGSPASISKPSTPAAE